MTREEFIKILDGRGTSYKIEGNKLLILMDNQSMALSGLTSIPPDVVFNNRGNVYLENLKTLQPGIVFNNTGRVILNRLFSISSGVVFENGGTVNLGTLIRGGSGEWDIPDINSKRIFNLMISKGLFEND